MSSSKSPKSIYLSNIHHIFWPIKKSEHKLFIPMALMMFCVLFNFGALRSVKDSLVVPNIGAEVISFLKLWLVLPSTLLFTVIYVKLSNMLNYEYLFYLLVSSFLTIFFIFTYILFPGQEQYHPCSQTVISLSAAYPHLKWFVLIAGKWSYALMYIACELWSAVIINLLFWQYANHIFDTESAKRFYPILGVIGNAGLILAGNFLVSFSDMSGVSDNNILSHYSTDINYQCNMVLKPVINAIIFSGICAMMLYRYIDRYVLGNIAARGKFPKVKESTKTKLSVKESLYLLIRSKYIGHITILVICYGFLINILEGPWKAKVYQLYPNTVDYLNFMGNFNIWMGISSVSFMFVGSNIIRRCKWVTAAIITPSMLLVTGIIFFTCVLFANEISIFGMQLEPLYFAVLIGAIQNILSKSTKYSLFDATKEMTYIPLSLELRTKGKAAVEVIGLKLGKSFGAFIQSFIFILAPMASFDSITSYLVIVFIVIMSLWIWNIIALNKEYIKISGYE